MPSSSHTTTTQLCDIFWQSPCSLRDSHAPLCATHVHLEPLQPSALSQCTSVVPHTAHLCLTCLIHASPVVRPCIALLPDHASPVYTCLLLDDNIGEFQVARGQDTVFVLTMVIWECFKKWIEYPWSLHPPPQLGNLYDRTHSCTRAACPGGIGANMGTCIAGRDHEE